MQSILRKLLVGTVLGLAILGLGGRFAMAAIARDAGQPSNWSFGGSMTVILLGGVSGLAGAAIAMVLRAATRQLAPRWTWLYYALVVLALGLVTLRGLRGTEPSGHWYFYGLVALYGTTLLLLTRETRQSHLPGRFANE